MQKFDTPYCSPHGQIIYPISRDQPIPGSFPKKDPGYEVDDRDFKCKTFASVEASNDQVSGRKRKATETTSKQAKRARVNEGKDKN